MSAPASHSLVNKSNAGGFVSIALWLQATPPLLAGTASRCVLRRPHGSGTHAKGRVAHRPPVGRAGRCVDQRMHPAGWERLRRLQRTARSTNGGTQLGGARIGPPPPFKALSPNQLTGQPMNRTTAQPPTATATDQVDQLVQRLEAGQQGVGRVRERRQHEAVGGLDHVAGGAPRQHAARDDLADARRQSPGSEEVVGHLSGGGGHLCRVVAFVRAPCSRSGGHVAATRVAMLGAVCAARGRPACTRTAGCVVRRPGHHRHDWPARQMATERALHRVAVWHSIVTCQTMKMAFTIPCDWMYEKGRRPHLLQHGQRLPGDLDVPREQDGRAYHLRQVGCSERTQVGLRVACRKGPTRISRVNEKHNLPPTAGTCRPLASQPSRITAVHVHAMPWLQHSMR